MTTQFQDFNRVESLRRGIDPVVSEAAWNTEGGLTEAARLGDFSGPPWFTGKSWWAPQLHYGGAGYESFGTAAGMGNGFSALTGWAPGDPAAWRDALRYALDRVQVAGWGAWYGPKTIGIVGMRGVDTNFHWGGTPAADWDYRTGSKPVPRVAYTPNAPVIPQDDGWSCAPTSLRWALTALGRAPGPSYIEDLLVQDGVVSHADGLLDSSGTGLAAWIGKHGAAYYGDEGFYGNNEPAITFDGAALEGGHTYPILIGGRQWGHWTGVSGYDAARDLLLLANPADGWMGVGQTMNRAQFDALGPFSMVRVLHPDLIGEPGLVPVPPPAPAPAIDKAEIAARLRAILAKQDAYATEIHNDLLGLIKLTETV